VKVRSVSVHFNGQLLSDDLEVRKAMKKMVAGFKLATISFDSQFTLTFWVRRVR
jgi:hypothetical protein